MECSWASVVTSAVGVTRDPVQHASAMWSGVLCTLTPLSLLFTQLDVRSVFGPLSQGLSHPGRGEDHRLSDICPGASRMHHHQWEPHHQHSWGQ